MEFLKKIGSWANHLTEIGISVIALGVVLEVLFKGAVIPFWPDVSAVSYTHLTLPTTTIV